MNTVNDRMLADIRAKTVEPPSNGGRDDTFVAVDVSDVNPAVNVFSGLCALLTAVLLWKGTTFAIASFAEHPVEAEFYPIARLSTIMRDVVVGIGAMLTGLTTICGLGVMALGVKVAIDPSAARSLEDKPAVEDTSNNIPTL